jgi:hypothetical protein
MRLFCHDLHEFYEESYKNSCPFVKFVAEKPISDEV